MNSEPPPSFPNLAGKHEHDALISPRDYLEYLRATREVPLVPDAVVLCYSRELVRQLLEEGMIEPLSRVSIAQIYSVKGSSSSVGVAAGFGIGAPSTAVVLEELTVLGSTHFVSMGVAGSLQRFCDIGSVVVCNKAIRDEGVSHHYLPAARYAEPDEGLTDRLKLELEKRQVDYESGPTWTIDTPYRETVEEAKHYQSEGILTVEMEAAAVFAVARVRGVAAAAAFVISDSLAELTWDPRFGQPEVVEGMRTLFSVSVAALESLSS